MKPHIFYLHGFASSPASTKARFFEERLAAFGLPLRCPDLNVPDFETVTIGRMLAQVEREILSLPPAPTVLFGSSLGAMVAVELASRWASRCSRAGAQAYGGHAIEKLVLLAPALDFARSREHHLGQEGLEQWRAQGTVEVFHHGEGRTRRVHYGLYEEALAHDPFSAYLDFPILIFHGRRDQLVDPETVIAFARSRPNVTLRLLDDEHQLLSSLDAIWRDTAAFLGLEADR